MNQPLLDWKHRLNRIIYETDTPAGYTFDVMLIGTILANTMLIILESVEGIRTDHEILLLSIQYIFVFIFTLEYILRIIVVEQKKDI